MNEFLISYSGPTLYILIDIENNILSAQSQTLNRLPRPILST